MRSRRGTAFPRHRIAFSTQTTKMAEELGDEDLVDYEEDEVVDDKPADEVKKGSTYSGIHASGFRDFLLKSEVLHECIPQAILGMDVICQAKSGMGKTAVFVLP